MLVNSDSDVDEKVLPCKCGYCGATIRAYPLVGCGPAGIHLHLECALGLAMIILEAAYEYASGVKEDFVKSLPETAVLRARARA